MSGRGCGFEPCLFPEWGKWMICAQIQPLPHKNGARQDLVPGHIFGLFLDQLQLSGCEWEDELEWCDDHPPGKSLGFCFRRMARLVQKCHQSPDTMLPSHLKSTQQHHRLLECGFSVIT